MPLISRTATLKRLDATAGYLLCRLIGRVRHYAGLAELAPTPAPANIRRVLLIRPGGMGDMLMLLPVIRSIRHARPDIHLDIVCEQRNFDVLRLAGLESCAILYDVAPQRLLSLRRAKYDVVLDTEQFHNFSAIMACMSGAPVRVGFRINPTRLSLYTHLVSYDVDGYELDQFARLLPAIGVPLHYAQLHGVLADTQLPLDAQPPSAIAEWRQRGPLVALSPGSSNPYKQWGFARFSELIRGLIASGAHVILVGGPAEDAQANALCENAPPGGVTNCVGRHPLARTAALLNAADLFIGGDSGLGHLAVALGRPSVTLFGPSDPRKWRRSTPAHRVLRKELPCSPCSIFGYHKLCRDIPCMRTITVAEVLEAAQGLLQEAAARGKA